MPDDWQSMLCACGGHYHCPVNGYHFNSYYDQSLGAEIGSAKQKTKIMRKQKVVDGRDFPSKNPLVHAAADKWRWRKSRGLA